MKSIVICFLFIISISCHSQVINNEVSTNVNDSLKKTQDKVTKLESEIKNVSKNIIKIDTVNVTDTVALTFNKNKIDSLNKVIGSLSEKKDSAQSTQKNLQKQKICDFRSMFSAFSDSMGTWTGKFWGLIEDGKQNTLSLTLPFTQDIATLYGEQVVDYIGPFRIAIVTSVTASKKVDSASATTGAKTKDELQSFFNAGGNFILKTDLPLLYFGNFNSDSLQIPNSRSLALYFSPRASANLPALGGSVEKADGIFELGTELYFSILTNQKFIKIQGRVRGALAFTNPEKVKTFTEREGKIYFWYANASLVLSIKDKFNIYINMPISKGSDFPINKIPVNLSVSTNF